MAVNETEAPELPSGEIAVEKPPSQVEAGGMGSIFATVIPMMGSMGVMVIMALTQGQNTRMLLMAGGMVFMMLSMVGFNIYRQVSQYRNKLNSQRREAANLHAVVPSRARCPGAPRRRRIAPVGTRSRRRDGSFDSRGHIRSGARNAPG